MQYTAEHNTASHTSPGQGKVHHMIYGIMSLLPMPGFNAMAVNPVIQHSGAVIYPGSRLVPLFPNPVAKGLGCVMP